MKRDLSGLVLFPAARESLRIEGALERMGEASVHPSPGGYRFHDVLIDVGRRRVLVAGDEARCQPLVFSLLVILCEARGKVVTREALLEALWPGDAPPSDESLTQLVHKLRTLLGQSGRLLVTVRNVGFRLDTKVQVLRDSGTGSSDAGPSPSVAARDAARLRVERLEPSAPEPDREAAPAAAPAPGPARAGAGRVAATRIRPVVVIAACVCVAALAAASLALLRDPVLDAGYDLRASDIGAARAGTADVVRRAFEADARGDRQQATALLEAAHGTDGRTPIAAAFLSIWARASGDRAADSWTAAAQARLAAASSPYGALVVRLARTLETDAERSTIDSMLQLRPKAWRLHLSRAHGALGRGDRALALEELRCVPIDAKDERRLAVALADRASLGDAAAAERDLAASSIAPSSAEAFYVRGRIALSRESYPQARALFDQAAELARRSGPDLVYESQLMAGIAARQLGDGMGALARLDRAALEASHSRRWYGVFNASVLGAYLASLRGDAEGRDRRLAAAEGVVQDGAYEQLAALTLVALRTGAPAPKLVMPEPAQGSGIPELVRARRALTEGRRADAEQLLRGAQELGVRETSFREEASLLAHDLGSGEEASFRVDPPYPNLVRITAAWELDRRRATAALASGARGSTAR